MEFWISNSVWVWAFGFLNFGLGTNAGDNNRQGFDWYDNGWNLTREKKNRLIEVLMSPESGFKLIHFMSVKKHHYYVQFTIMPITCL